MYSEFVCLIVNKWTEQDKLSLLFKQCPGPRIKEKIQGKRADKV